MFNKRRTSTVQNGRTYEADVYEFASVGEYVATLSEKEYLVMDTNGGSRFSGGETYQDSLNLALKGREDWAQKAGLVYDLLETGGIELEVHQWGADRAGAFPCVPDYLAGIPENMRRRLTNQSDLAPVAIYADIAASAGFDSDSLCKRGAAVLALCMALSQHRPTTLYLVCGLSTSYRTENELAGFTVIKCDTIPMDLAQLAYLFGSAGFFRNLGFAFGHKEFDFCGHWPWNDHSPGGPRNVERCKAVLGLAPTDLYVPGIHASDEAVRNPVKWITENLERYKQHTED